MNTQFSTREVPWMKLGKLVDHPQTAAQAAQLGGLDFKVVLRDVGWIESTEKYGGTGVHTVPVESRKAVIREDTSEFFDFVSAGKYHPLQYSQAFEFMDTVNPEFVAAGALRGGRQGFMVVRAPDDAQINIMGNEDPHELFAVLRTSHDRSRGVEVMVMPLRGLCMNQMTLRSFSAGVQHRWAIKHTSSMESKLTEASKSLKNLARYARRYEEVATKLIATKIGPTTADHMLRTIIPMPSGKTQRVDDQYDEKIGKILKLWTGADTVAFPGTGWGLLNAVSEYYDWERAGGTAESRFIAALQGQTHNIINKTAGLLLAAA